VISDGELSVGERVMMEEMRKEMALSADFDPHYLNVEGTREIFDTRRSRSIVLISLVRLGYADGAFEIEEQSFLKVLCNEFEISNDDFALIENWVRRLITLEREANAFL
jgi:tellurite resistance protein|tara:strand:+ start:10435 stop:10761 length:327 start_codon:yes stop_codon:yes gene_type:complete